MNKKGDTAWTNYVRNLQANLRRAEEEDYNKDAVNYSRITWEVQENCPKYSEFSIEENFTKLRQKLMRNWYTNVRVESAAIVRES